MEDSTTAIPKTIDNMMKFLFWDFDVALSFLLGFGLGIALGQLMVGGVAGGLAAWGFSAMRAGKARGFARHLVFWHLPISLGLKRTPPSHVREFLG
jgi:conjugal transfer pilus assembly protein TraL